MSMTIILWISLGIVIAWLVSWADRIDFGIWGD